MIGVVKIETYKRPKEQYSMEPAKFTLWLFLITVTMLFAAFTSALVVSRTDAIENNRWMTFDIPSMFTVSTILIVLSSVSMQWAYFAAKRNEVSLNCIMLWATFILGAGFVWCQWLGYQELIAAQVHLIGGSTSSSFFYVISGIHALHVVGGLFIVLVTLFSAYRYRVHSKNMLRINLCTTYWHFIGALWVYLFILLKLV